MEVPILNIGAMELNNGGVNGGLNEGVNKGEKNLFEILKKYPNKRTPFFSEKLAVPTKTIERWMKKLRIENKIEFTGSSKTSGYYIKKHKN